MNLIYWDSVVKNFGDELNKDFWFNLFGQRLKQFATDEAILGIGSILNYDTSAYKRIHVLGSGSGYSTLKIPNINDYKFWFVRGPNTAKVLGIDSNLAITDPAILVQDIYKFKVPCQKTGKKLFIPHYTSALDADWEEVCSRAGMSYRDPRSSLEDICNDIASSELVISESLHGAILADMYRVPWILVATPPIYRSDFKWHDWCASLNLEYVYNELPWLHTNHLSFGRRTVNLLKSSLAANNIGPNRWLMKRFVLHGEKEIDACAQILLKISRQSMPRLSRDDHFDTLKTRMYSALEEFSRYATS